MRNSAADRYAKNMQKYANILKQYPNFEERRITSSKL